VVRLRTNIYWTCLIQKFLFLSSFFPLTDLDLVQQRFFNRNLSTASRHSDSLFELDFFTMPFSTIATIASALRDAGSDLWVILGCIFRGTAIPPNLPPVVLAEGGVILERGGLGRRPYLEFLSVMLTLFLFISSTFLFLLATVTLAISYVFSRVVRSFFVFVALPFLSRSLSVLTLSNILSLAEVGLERARCVAIRALCKCNEAQIAALLEEIAHLAAAINQQVTDIGILDGNFLDVRQEFNRRSGKPELRLPPRRSFQNPEGPSFDWGEQSLLAVLSSKFHLKFFHSIPHHPIFVLGMS
jgi:hypothetical protein